MYKFLTANLLLALCSLSARSQNIENSIALYGNNFPVQKIHVQFDKNSYLPGETAWFKAYIMEENLPATKSTNFYIGFYNEQGKVIEQKLYPIINASADGYFKIPDSITGSQLICRAYTAWMLNFDTSFLFTQAIKLFTNKITSLHTAVTTSLQFFPEGGDMIAAERNTVAFKCNYHNGVPFEIKGVIKKQETGEVITTIASVHDGMGKFDIETEPGQKYYAEWADQNGALQQSFLPEQKAKGVSLKLVQQKTKLYYNVVNKLPADTLHVLAYMYQKIIYKASLPLPEGERYTGLIPLDSFPTGTLQLTVFNSGWQPLAERICFINNNNYTLPAQLNAVISSTKQRGKNTIEIAVADTIAANLSLAVTDADFNNDYGNSNIITHLLLSGDVRGYIHNPAYYFTSNSNAVLKEQLDLVMLTHGWRRYNWTDMLAGKMPALKFPADNFLSVYGQVGNEALNKIKKDEQVNLIVKTKDSTTNYYFTTADKTGMFKTGGLIFYDTARVYYSFNTAKQYNKQMVMAKANYSLQQPQIIDNYFDQLIKDTTGTGYTAAASLYKYYIGKNDSLDVSKAKLLQGVVVKSGGWRNWKNDPNLKMDEKYSRGMFSGGANSFSLDVLHDEKAWTKLDVLNYIRNNIPGLVVGKYDIINGRSLTYIQKPVFVYIDEHEMESSDLENLSLTQIAYIKLIPSFMGRAGSPLAQVLSIYTKKGDDLIDRSSKETDLGMVKIPGYSPTKEFYSPDYAESNTGMGNDSRTTLLWQPYIFTDKNNLKIPVSFYNNDFSKRIKLVLEGMNEEGKLVHIEKIIE